VGRRRALNIRVLGSWAAAGVQAHCPILVGPAEDSIVVRWAPRTIQGRVLFICLKLHTGRLALLCRRRTRVAVNPQERQGPFGLEAQLSTAFKLRQPTPEHSGKDPEQLPGTFPNMPRGFARTSCERPENIPAGCPLGF
jgi:hypothetical protein